MGEVCGKDACARGCIRNRAAVTISGGRGGGAGVGGQLWGGRGGGGRGGPAADTFVVAADVTLAVTILQPRVTKPPPAHPTPPPNNNAQAAAAMRAGGAHLQHDVRRDFGALYHCRKALESWLWYVGVLGVGFRVVLGVNKVSGLRMVSGARSCSGWFRGREVGD